MNAPLLGPPYPAPWDTTREGGVKSADGDLIGYCRYERLGDLARMQAAARWFAASPRVVNALLAVLIAAQAKDKDAFTAARHEAVHSLQALRDPALAENVGLNAEITAVIRQLNLEGQR